MANLWLQIYTVLSLCAQVGQADSNVSQSFVIEPNDIIAIEGSNVSLPCILKKPGYAQWIRNGICLNRAVPNLEENSHYEIKTNTSDDFTLQIFNVSLEDVGVYQCLGYENSVVPIASRAAMLLVFDMNILRPPELGDDFIRYVAISDVGFTCQSSFNSEDFADLSVLSKNWMTASNNMQLNQIFGDLSGMTYNCQIRDPVLQKLPPISLNFQISYSKKIILKTTIGSKESESLVCVAEPARDTKLLLSCYSLQLAFEETRTPKMLIACEFGLSKLLACTVKGEELFYTFFVCVAPNDPCQFDPKIAFLNLDMFVLTKTSDPTSFIWNKQKPASPSVNEVAIIKDKRESCNADRTHVLLQLEIDHENHNVPLEIPISMKNVDEYTQNCGIFQVTCFYWLWKDKIFTIYHEGIVIPKVCKVITLQIKVTVTERNLFDAVTTKCNLLNKPKTPFIFQQFSKIPNIYPIAGVICLICVTIMTMIYIGRRLLALYDRAGRPRARRQTDRSAQAVPSHPQKKTYTRFLNEDETATNKVTLI